MRVCVLMVGLIACSGDDQPADTNSGDTDVASTTDTGGSTGTDPLPAPQALIGTLHDVSGNGIAATLMLCNAAFCLQGESDASGSFEIDGAATTPYAFEPQPPEPLAVTLIPMVFAADEQKHIDVIVPALDASHPLGATPTELELGDGLFVTVGKNDLAPPSFEQPATTAAGVRTPDDAIPPIEVVTGTPLAVWYTAPFNYTAENGLPFRIENTFGLADGDTAEVYVGSYDDHAWVDVGVVTVTDGYLSGPGKLPKLSTILLVKP
jgi:hypothetical protein